VLIAIDWTAYGFIVGGERRTIAGVDHDEAWVARARRRMARMHTREESVFGYDPAKMKLLTIDNVNCVNTCLRGL
jgi:hypothetical protein